MANSSESGAPPPDMIGWGQYGGLVVAGSGWCWTLSGPPGPGGSGTPSAPPCEYLLSLRESCRHFYRFLHANLHSERPCTPALRAQRLGARLMQTCS